MKPIHVYAGLAAICAGLALPAAASAAEGYARAAAPLRAGAANDYPRVGFVARGEQLDIFGCLRGYGWCDVAAGGERGWFPGSRIVFERQGRRVPLMSFGADLGVGIVTFGFNDYWNSHYRDRPWFREGRWWRRNGMPPPGGTADQGRRRPGMSQQDQPDGRKPQQDTMAPAAPAPTGGSAGGSVGATGSIGGGNAAVNGNVGVTPKTMPMAHDSGTGKPGRAPKMPEGRANPVCVPGQPCPAQ